MVRKYSIKEENSEAYSITKIPLITRMVNIILIFTVFFGGSFLFLRTVVKDNKDYEGIAWFLIFILIGCYMLWRSFKTTEIKKLTGTLIINKNLINKKNISRAILMVFISAVILIWLSIKLKADGGDFGIAIFALVIILFALGSYILQEVKQQKVFLLTAAARAEQQRLDEINAKKSVEDAEKWALIEDKWWYRYGLATLILLGAWWFSEYKPNLWWVSVIAALVAMFYAKELSILIIGLLALWLIGQGLASLSVTGAILVGACIIAIAISSNK